MNDAWRPWEPCRENVIAGVMVSALMETAVELGPLVNALGATFTEHLTAVWQKNGPGWKDAR